MSEELKSCPWCGEPPTWSERAVIRGINDGEIPYQLGCGNKACLVEPYGKIHKTEKQAIAAWNLRSEPAGKETKG